MAYRYDPGCPCCSADCINLTKFASADGATSWQKLHDTYPAVACASKPTQNTKMFVVTDTQKNVLSHHPPSGTASWIEKRNGGTGSLLWGQSTLLSGARIASDSSDAWVLANTGALGTTVEKRASDGSLSWSKSDLFGIGVAQGCYVDVDSSDNIILGWDASTTGTNLIQLDSSGSTNWSKSLSTLLGSGATQILGLFVDTSDNIVILYGGTSVAIVDSSGALSTTLTLAHSAVAPIGQNSYIRGNSSDNIISLGLPAFSEMWRLKLTGQPTGGTFTITIGGYTTSGISYNATAANVVSALEALAPVAVGDILAFGGPLPDADILLQQVNNLAPPNCLAMTVNGSGLTGGLSPAADIFDTLRCVQSHSSTDGSVNWRRPIPVTSTFAATYARNDVSDACAFSDCAGNGPDITSKQVWKYDGSGNYVWSANYGHVNEKQKIEITGAPTGGTFTLTYSGQTTGAIDYDATAAEVDTALEALSNIASGDLTGTGGPLPGSSVYIEFGGTLRATNVALMTDDDTGLTGGSSPAVTVTEEKPGRHNAYPVHITMDSAGNVLVFGFVLQP